MKQKSTYRAQLEKESKKHQTALEDDLHSIVDQSKSILVGAAVVGVGFWAAYVLFKSLSGSDKVSKKQSKKATTTAVPVKSDPSIMSLLKHTILKEIAMFLLVIIKEKTIEHLQNIKSDVKNS